MVRRILVLLAVLLAQRAHADPLEARVTDGAGRPLAGAVVFLQPADGAAVPAPPAVVARMDQVGKEFVPRVLVVQAGSQVSFPNSDDIRHHVYSFSDAKNFELPLYAGTPADPVAFPVPGVVTLGCNIHDWMRAYLLVTPGPWFATTGDDGVARIPATPPGPWRAFAWHPDLPEQKPVPALGADAPSPAFSLALKPQPRIRRAPSARGGERY